MLPDMKRFKRGLIVGKFSPLHLGHEYLIRQAETECDELVLLCWSKPELPGCYIDRRRRWLKRRFAHLRALVLNDNTLQRNAKIKGVSAPPLPDNHAPETESRHFVGWVCENLLHFRPDAVFTSENYGDGFAKELTQYFRRQDISAKDVVHRCVDIARTTIPISGTELREDPHTHSTYLAPEIYADFVDRIALLGGESTGKTTLAKALAKSLKTHWVPEFGREYWEEKKGNLRYPDMLHIAQTQIAREKNLAARSQRYLICDSTPLTTYFYSQELFDRTDPELIRLAERDYAWVFLCAADFEFVQDGTRRDNTFRLKQQRWYEHQLTARDIPYTLLRGSVKKRIDQILRAIKSSE